MLCFYSTGILYGYTLLVFDMILVPGMFIYGIIHTSVKNTAANILRILKVNVEFLATRKHEGKAFWFIALKRSAQRLEVFFR